MHRPNYLEIKTNTTTAAYPIDRYVNGYALGMSYSNATGTATYTLQYSLLDPYLAPDGNPYTTSYKVSGQWQNWDDSTLVNATTSKSTNLAFTARAVRAITSNVSAQTLTFSIIPMGMDAN